jgi:creatinine amidohydrolase
MEFPGTIAIRPSTLMNLVRDVAQSAYSHGLTRILFVNGHGGNKASIQAGFYELYADLKDRRGEELRLALVNWWELQPVIDYVAMKFGDAEGSHASPSEIAVAWHAYPEAERKGNNSPPIAPSGAFYDARDFRKRFADGRIGSDSSLASISIGKELTEIAVQSLAERYLTFVRAE